MSIVTAYLNSGRTKASRYPPEAGRLTRDGKVFRDSSGAVWQWRGASMFLLFARFLRGEDIRPQIAWMLRQGVNVARVFGCVPWGGEWEYFRTPWLGWIPMLDSFVTLLEQSGIRCEFVPNTYAPGSRPYTQQAFDIASAHWGMTVEIGNEPAVNNLDVQTLVHGIGHSRVLSSYGIYEQPGNVPYDPWNTMPHLDYVTVHSPRDSHWPRNAKDGMEIRDALGCPVVLDEPWGAGEVDKDGGGSRRTQVEDFRSYFGISHLFSAGATFHSQAGLEGRCPSKDEPIQQSIADAISAVWDFMPAMVQTGEYSAPHIGNFPLKYETGDSTQDHAYASLFEHEGWVTIPRQRDGFVAQGVNGWAVTKTLPVGCYKVER